MWIPMILVCANSLCSGIGGPVYETLQECEDAMQNIGAPYMRVKYPHYEILDIQCLSWGVSS